MKSYRIRKGSPLDEFLQALPGLLFFIAFIVVTGLGNHFIDGL